MTYRCIACGFQMLSENAHKHQHTSCPGCGNGTLPADAAEDVIISINWSELRILANAAESYYSRLYQAGALEPDAMVAMNAILSRLEAQRPKKTMEPLTVSMQIAALKAAGCDISVHDARGSLIMPSREDN